LKLLFTDLDRTLLNTENTVTEKTRKAIQEACDAGHRVIIATGRPFASSRPLCDALGLNHDGCYLLCFNGALIYDFSKRAAIYDRPVKMEYVEYVFQKAKEQNIYVQTYDDTGVVTPKTDENTIWYCDRNKLPYREDPDLPKSLPKEPNKVIFLNKEDHEPLEQFRASLGSWAKGKVDLFFSGPELLECVETGVSKGAAVQWLADYLNVPISDTLAAGDSENDIPMILAAGTGCAMQNATDACKEAADYITEHDCDHDGVAEIIHKFMLEE